MYSFTWTPARCGERRSKGLMMPPKLKTRIDDHPPMKQLPPTPTPKTCVPIALMRNFDAKTVWDLFGKVPGKNAPPAGYVILPLNPSDTSMTLWGGVQVSLEWHTRCSPHEGRRRYWCVYVEAIGQVTEPRKKYARVLFPIIAPPKAARSAGRR